MSSITRLQLSGVRSFNPHVTERQTVEFDGPLTIILGKNGAGKTTIIESLLNATTGQMPPGAAGGERCSFVYDPNIAGEGEVKAQIRLNFNTRSNEQMQVVRTFQSTKGKGGRVQFQTIDSTLAFKDERGKVSTSTYKCTDMDALMPDLLGVTRSVLEHVIFCHQEDCNWPLGPPAQVKERFDELFASTRYVGALDKLRDAAKEYRANLKRDENLLIMLREHREQARSIREQIKQKEEAIRLVQLRMRDVEPQLNQYSAALQQLDTAMAQSENLTREQGILRGRIEEQERSLAHMNPNARNVKQSLPELQGILGGFDSHVNKLRAELRDKEKMIATLEDRRKAAEVDSSKRRADLHVAETRQQDYSKHTAELQAAVRVMARDPNSGVTLPPHSSSSSSSSSCADSADAAPLAIDANSLLQIESQLAKRVQDIKSEITAQAERHRLQMDDISNKRAVTHRNMDADTKEQDMKTKLGQAAAQKATELRRSAPGSSATDADVARLRKDVQGIAARVEQQRKAASSSSAQKEADALLKRLDAAQRELSAVRSESQELAAVQDALRKQQCMANFAEEHLQSRVIGPLTELKVAATTKVRDAPHAEQLATTLKTTKSKMYAAFTEERRAEETAVATLERQRRDTEAKLKSCEAELANKQQMLQTALSASSQADVETAIATAEAKLRDVASELSDRKSQSACYEQFIEVAQRDSKCATCERDFAGDEVSRFIKSKQQLMSETPTAIKDLAVEKGTLERRLTSLRPLVSVAQRVAELSERVIPELRGELGKIDAELTQKRATVANLQSQAAEFQQQIERAGSILADAQRAVQLFKELADFQESAPVLAAQQSRLGSSNKKKAGPNNDDAEDVDAKIADLRRRADEKEKEVQDLQSQFAAVQKTLRSSDSAQQELNHELLQKQGELLRLESSLTKRTEMLAAAVAAEKEADDARARLKEIEGRQANYQSQLREFESAIQAANQSFTQERNRLNALEQQLSANLSKISSGMQAIKKYLEVTTGNSNNKQRGKEEDEVARAKQLLDQAEASVKKIEVELKTVRDTASKLQDTIRNQHKHESDIKESVRALQQQESVQKLKAQLAANEAELGTKLQDAVKSVSSSDSDMFATTVTGGGGGGGDQHNNFSKMRELCRTKIRELEQSRAQNRGAMEMMTRDVADQKGTLEKDKFQEVDKKYASTFVKVQTTELAISDVDKYYKALERAVSSYHQEKIAQINKIISDLWRAVYRGSDIDAIEIRSDDDAASSTTSRRSYKYRVVMKRGGMELDMRGRCSAGQKVLASVVIRLALSEAFCCECAILALDEPTTNLDADNAKALAQELRALIDLRRSSMKHFQLIVITHDEDFVRCLGARSEDKIYFVEKDRDGQFSLIRKKTYDQLFG